MPLPLSCADCWRASHERGSAPLAESKKKNLRPEALKTLQPYTLRCGIWSDATSSLISAKTPAESAFAGGVIPGRWEEPT